MIAYVGNVWTRCSGVVPFGLVKLCSFYLKRRVYAQRKRPEIPLMPCSLYKPSSKSFPTGLLPLLMKKGVKFEKFVDVRKKPSVKMISAPDFLLSSKKYRFQVDAFKKAISCSRGIIKFVTGGGKTYLACALSRSISCDTLVLVNRKVIHEQFVSKFDELLDEEFGILGAGQRSGLNRRVVISMVQSALTSELDLSRFGMVIVDECHHVGWETRLAKILSVMGNAYFRYGLSGTPIREGGDHLVSIGFLGPVIFDFGYRDAVPKKVVVPAKVFFCRYPHAPGFVFSFAGDCDYMKLYSRLIVENEVRNACILTLVSYLLERMASLQILILVHRIAHGEALICKLEEMFSEGNVAFVFSATPQRETLIRKFSEGALRVLVATEGVLGEGADIHNIDVLIVAGGYKSNVMSIQNVGRALRLNERKSYALIFDFFDDMHKILLRHSRTRKKNYIREGYEVKELVLKVKT